MNPLDAVNQLGHAESLGRLEDLPADYVKAINDLSVAPLWPQFVACCRADSHRAPRSPSCGATPTCARTCCAPAS